MKPWLRRLTLRSIHVNTPDETFEGVLLTEAPDGVVLTSATMHGPDGAVKMAGNVFIPRDRISFVQVVPAK